ncbi:twin-arginine translocase TatA/TatE family subunit [Actinoplanes sp. LDG1-06]|uniref:Twin-arginine translocase TatA/TatE family subunit n=1 Tax=Paractinoplanes ovalisporus TaxID=2810368 RepID=A0ABS2A300_9ACTN|nr:twin-arginine translocase TatA/TatE family subunit [Actinoplanes ovalisporus]MBM2614206.1 twin-arginine translocase TatA/TatE family subunit [Actinoplanes ovalisporus]
MRDWMIPALLILILVVFGSKRLPGMAQSLGQSLRILRKESTHDPEPETTEPVTPPPLPPPAATPHAPAPPQAEWGPPRPALPAERRTIAEPDVIRRDAQGR